MAYKLSLSKVSGVECHCWQVFNELKRMSFTVIVLGNTHLLSLFLSFDFISAIKKAT